MIISLLINNEGIPFDRQLDTAFKVIDGQMQKYGMTFQKDMPLKPTTISCRESIYSDQSNTIVARVLTKSSNEGVVFAIFGSPPLPAYHSRYEDDPMVNALIRTEDLYKAARQQLE